MESMTARDFYLFVSEPMELPPREYLIVLNVDAEPEQLDEVDSIECLIKPEEYKVCFTDLDGQLVGEVKLEEWRKKAVHARIDLTNGKFLECSVDLDNEEQMGVFHVGKEENAELRSGMDEDVVGIEHRLEVLVDNIKKDMDLMKDYENELRYERDPALKQKYKKNIKDLHNSIANHQQEYLELKSKGTAKGVSSKISKRMNEVGDDLRELSQAHTKLDQLLKGLQNIRDDISEFEFSVMSRFEANEQRIISAVVDRLEQSELAVVNTILDTVGTMGFAAGRIEEILASVRETLVEIRDLEGAVSDAILSKAAGEVLEVVDDPKLDVKHRLKVTIPIIPVILKYEGIVALKSGMNLEKAWKWLTKKVTGGE